MHDQYRNTEVAIEPGDLQCAAILPLLRKERISRPRSLPQPCMEYIRLERREGGGSRHHHYQHRHHGWLHCASAVSIVFRMV